MNYRWSYTPPDENKVLALQESLKISRTLCELLVLRSIETFEAARHFFRPSVEQLHDPFLLKDMEKAVQRIEKAIANDEKIMVYGDYDVDGTTAVSLVYGFFSSFYDNLTSYIPDRYKEGYGVSFTGIDVAHEKGISLIIALDCGVKAIDKVAYAKEKGIDFIICDHHRPGDILPDAVAILDAKQSDCTYPYDELCGCGVGFKLAQAFAQRNHIPFSELEKQFDLLVISIASDIVPITGENRTMAFLGLKKINETPRIGIQELIELGGMADKKTLTVTDLVFTVGPRINAAGRLDTGNKAVELLLADKKTAADIAVSINQNNTDRKVLDRSITAEALEMIDESDFLKSKKSTVLHSPNWHKGVIGIVASRVMETYYRPTVILTTANGKVVGSARSVKGFDVYNALHDCEEHMLQFGGHMYAAGMTMSEEQVPAFIEKFEEVVSNSITDEQLQAEIILDAPLELHQINMNFYDIIEQMAPFGPQNMRPTFWANNVMDTGWSKLVGQTQDHVKLHIRQGNSESFSGIAFNLKNKFHIIKNSTFDVCFQLDLNEWNGKTTIQLRVKDVRPAEDNF